MTCEKFNNLTVIEKVQFIGKLMHAVREDDELFNLGNSIIATAEIKGLFDKVTILPNDNKDY